MSFLYDLIVKPIEILVEIIYNVAYGATNNYGLSIIVIGIVIQTLVLPLYKRAEQIQDQERHKQKEMSHWVNHIKRTFKGDEQFFMLSTYYRQQNYKPWYALRSSFSVVLQIPFFIAAYNYLYNLKSLNGQSFYFIQDLGVPDNTFFIGSFAINILPIVMTLFNIVSGIIYTRDKGTREKVQVYGLAAIFIILLYNSPYGLVLYWTVNNIYSLVKNILLNLIKLPKLRFKLWNLVTKDTKNKDIFKIYLYQAIFMTCFIGGIIILNVVLSSPSEFYIESDNPFKVILYNLTVYTGVFLLWGTLIVYLMNNTWQVIYSTILFILEVITVINYVMFDYSGCEISSFFVYNSIYIDIDKVYKSIYIYLIASVACIIISLGIKKVYKQITRVLALVSVVILIINMSKLYISTIEITDKMSNNYYDSFDDNKLIQLSKNGQNVIVFMLDRAVGGYVPFEFDDNPELAEAFEGFTYYPNTLSFGGSTNLALKPVFGGYEYTPLEVNKRTTETLRDKNDEALLLLPTLFSKEGYNVSVIQPVYAGYMWEPDLSIYDGIENVKAYDPYIEYRDDYFYELRSQYSKYQNYNAVYYSLMRTLPPILQIYLFNDGKYLDSDSVEFCYYNYNFNYRLLESLVDMTEIKDDNSNNIALMCNESTHEVTLLDDSMSTGTKYLDDKSMKLENITQIRHYQCNIESLEQLATWIKYIKENGCWDNTRIIIVADHGFGLGQFDYMLFDEVDIERFNPLLLVKDFNSTEYTVSDELMTNADVPTLALDGLIDNPINPFTGNEITSEAKNNTMYITMSYNWSLQEKGDTTYDTEEYRWLKFNGTNIFDESNYELVDKP